MGAREEKRIFVPNRMRDDRGSKRLPGYECGVGDATYRMGKHKDVL